MSSRKKGFKKVGASGIYVVLSTALVLFLVGISFLFFLHGRRLVQQFKESIEFQVILKDSANIASYTKLKDQIASQPYVHSIELVSKDEAMNRYIAQTGDDFKEMLDYNPLYASINIKLNARYANEDSIARIENSLTKHPLVAEFYYEKKLVDIVNDNIKKITMVVIAISILLLLITIALIDSTTRLAMYSNRFLIRSMQLVGATRWFILKPFIARGIINGLLSSLIGVGALATMLNIMLKIIPGLNMLQDVTLTLTLFGLVFLVGILFSVLSTYFAVIRYLKMKLDDLY